MNAAIVPVREKANFYEYSRKALRYQSYKAEFSSVLRATAMQIYKLLLAGLYLSLISLCSSCSLYSRVTLLEKQAVALKDHLAEQEKQLERQLSNAQANFQAENKNLRLTVNRQSRELKNSWLMFEKAYSPLMRKRLYANLQSSIETKKEIERLKKESLALLNRIINHEKTSKRLCQTVARHELEARRDNQIVALRQAVKRIEQLSNAMEARSIQMSSDLSESKNSALSASNSARNSLANSDTARVNSELALEQSKDARNEADSARQYASQVGEFTHRINRIRHNEQSLRRDLAKTKQHYNNMICGINNALGRRNSDQNRIKNIWNWIRYLDSRLKATQANNIPIKTLQKKLTQLQNRVNTLHSVQNP
jgi:hypothetical protein